MARRRRRARCSTDGGSPSQRDPCSKQGPLQQQHQAGRPVRSNATDRARRSWRDDAAVGISRARRVPGPSAAASSAGAQHGWHRVVSLTAPAAPDRRRALDFFRGQLLKKRRAARAAQLFKRPGTRRDRVRSRQARTSAIPAVRCGQIFRSSRLTLNKSQ